MVCRRNSKFPKTEPGGANYDALNFKGLIIATITRLTGMCTDHKTCALCFTTKFVRNIFRSNKYLASYFRGAKKKNICRYSHKASFITADRN